MEYLTENRIGFVWLYGLVAMFILSIIGLVIIPAVTNKVVPSIKDSATSSLSVADAALVNGKIDTIVTIVRYSPFVVLFSVFVYMIVATFLREQYEYV